ncbi:TIR domain-containing protein [bacterium]|nr:TIR domain-containing protein [bacterium]
MNGKKKLVEVFKTIGLPQYTYVKPAHYGEVRADVEQPGKHLLIEGPSGTGKTCVIYKIFEDLKWTNGTDFLYVSCRDANAEIQINNFFECISNSVSPSCPMIVIDDFHLLSVTRRMQIGGNLKRLSDRAYEQSSPPKAILIGIPASGISLLSDAYDLGPRLGSYKVTKASDNEIDQLITEGEIALNILFEDRDILLGESAGNFWLAQYICSKVCAVKEVHETQDEVKILSFDLLGIRQRLMSELSQRYMHVAKTFAKGKKWRPGGNKPYLELLLALAKVPDSVVTFDKILNLVPDRRKPGLKAIRSRIAEVIWDPSKNIDMRKHIAFESDSGFSIEDPLFRYFLSNLQISDLYREIGIEPDNVEHSKLYTYDIGFSFAGEVRLIVETINTELKNEDVVTFYDYDQQSFLLALDLENTLKRIYKESCRYYLVFLDANYSEKVWTKYERDIMTKSGRKNHIIPILLDEKGTEGTVGIPTTIGCIDLRSQWASIVKYGAVNKDTREILRNRCIIPLLEKLDTFTTIV